MLFWRQPKNPCGIHQSVLSRENIVNKKQNPLGIRVGDVVQIHFSHMPSKGAFSAKVTEVTDRTTMGCDAHIAYEPEESARDYGMEALNIPYGCSVSHVVKVLNRAPYVSIRMPPANIFRLHAERRSARRGSNDWVGYYRFGGTRVCHGDMETLIVEALASASDTLNRPLDIHRFRQLWTFSGHRGRVELPRDPRFDSEWSSHYTAVNWKVFKQFVLANRHRILLTRREMEKAGREHQKAMHDEYFREEEQAAYGEEAA